MMNTRKMITVIALFVSYVCCFGQTEDSRANLVNNKHEEFSKKMNLLESNPSKNNRTTLLKNIDDILDNSTVADQHLVEKSIVRKFPIDFQYKRFLFFKGKKKKSIRYVSTISEIDSVKYVYNIIGTAVKDTLTPANSKFVFYETKGEAKVNTAQRRSKNSKRFVDSETKNILTLVWKVNPKNNKVKIDTIYAEPVEFFNSEIAQMQEKGKALIEKYYRNLIEKESIPELKASAVQSEFSSDYKPVSFYSMFEGNSYIKITNLAVTPAGVTKYEEEPIIIFDVAREAYFKADQTVGNRLGLRFAIAFNKNLKNEKIVKVEWMFGEKFEPENKFGAKNLKDAQQVGESFVKRLQKYVNTGAKDKALEAELIEMFINSDAIVETSSVRSNNVTNHSIKEYLTSLNQRVRELYDGKKGAEMETIVDKPTSFSNSNIIEMKFKQTFKGGKYCDKTEKKIEMVYEEGKYSITKVSVLETKDCK